MKNIVGIFFLITLIFASCNSENYADIVEFSSDLEQIKDKSFLTTSSIELSAAKYRSDDKARSGMYSVRLDSTRKKALRGEIDNLKIGDELHIQVWRNAPGKNKGELFVKIGHPMVFKTSEAIKKEGEWELLEIKVAIPNEFKGHKLIWYVGSKGKDDVYFDDLSLKLKRNKGLVLHEHPLLPKINLDIKAQDYIRLEEKRSSAIESGVLVTSSDDWIKTKISWNDKTKKGKIRLKGDWTDHLYGQKFSLRVNISKNKTLNDYSKFSIQNPVSRHYIDEWFVHKILQEEDVLTTRYEFADLYINEESRGLYAIEEHFTPELLMSQGRAVGPIFKYTEDDLWYDRYIHDKRQTKGVPWYPGAIIEVFSQDEILEDPNLIEDFFRGRDLMYRFKFKLGKATSIVDVEKMASNLALMDLCAGYHSVIWHNQRFYYNAKKDLLEPLIYDIFQESSRLKKDPMIFLGWQYIEKPNSYKVSTLDFLFQDQTFIDWYIHYLEKYSAPDFFDSFESSLQQDIDLYESEIQKEYDYYTFDLDLYHERAANIRAHLNDFKIRIQKMLTEDRSPSYGKFNPSEDYDPIKNVSLHAYINFLSGKTALQLQSFYYKPITIKGLVVQKEKQFLAEPVTLSANSSMAPPETTVLEIQAIPEKVIFTIEGSDSLYTEKVIKYRAPLGSDDEE